MLGISDRLITKDSHEGGTEGLYCENCGWDWDDEVITELPDQDEMYKISVTTRAPMTR
jgi:hypothetical protein